jgi:hypothetical protein
MDAFHQRLAKVALDAAARYGFCLAGGYAVQARGFGDRVPRTWTCSRPWLQPRISRRHRPPWWRLCVLMG